MVPLASWCQAATFGATAGVGFDQVTDTTTEAGSSASAEVSGTAGIDGNARATASVDSDFNLATFATSKNFAAVQSALANSFIISSYRIVGSPDIFYPIRFNFNLTGSLSASTAPFPAVTSAASATVSYRILGASAASTSGSSTLLSQAGIPIPITTGAIGESSIRARITPSFSLGAGRTQFTQEELNFLLSDVLVPPNLEYNIKELQTEVSVLEGIIANQFINRGLPTRGLLPGWEPKIGFDTDFVFDTTISQ